MPDQGHELGDQNGGRGCPALQGRLASRRWPEPTQHSHDVVLQALKSGLLGRKVTVRGCGLFIDAQRPWLAASPDGVVTDGANEWLLEVKCPYKHRDKRVRDACREDKNFCLREEPDGVRTFVLYPSSPPPPFTQGLGGSPLTN